MVNPGELRGRRGMNERGGRGERGEHVGNGGSRQNGRFGGMGGHDGSLLTIPQPLQDQLTTGKEAIWMRIGSLRLSFDDKDGALNAYETALRYNPDSLTAMTQAGAVLVKTEQFPKAVQYLRRAIQADPKCGEAWAVLAHCYVMTDELNHAYHAYQNALAHLANPDDPNLWYGIGLLYDRFGSLEHALEAFLTVLEISPDFERVDEVCFCIGIIYKEQKNYDKALEFFFHVIKAESPPPPLTRADALFQIGHVTELKGNTFQAIETYKRALQENPKHVKTLQELGWLYHIRNNNDEALQLLRLATEADPDDGQSWYIMGRIYMALREFQPAYSSYQQAVHRDPKNPRYWCSIGVLYYKRNQYKDAMDAYARAIRIDPTLSEVWYDLGTLYEAYNQPKDAIAAYQAALDGVPENRDNSAIRERIAALEERMSGQKSSTGLPNAAHGSGEMLSSLEHPLVGSQVQMYPLTGGTSDTPMPSPLTHQLPQLQTQHPLGRPSQLSAPHNPLTSHASHGLPKSSIASSGIVPETGMPSLSQATGLSRQSLSGLVSQPYGSMKDSQVPPLAQPSIHASPGSIHHLRTEPSLNQARLGENDRAVSKSDRLEIGAYRKKERENSPMLKPLHAVTNPSGESKQSTFNLFPSRRAEKANTAPAWEKKPLGKADNGSNNESAPPPGLAALDSRRVGWDDGRRDMMGSLPPLNFAVRGSLDKRPSRPNQAPPEVITPNKRRRSPHDSEKDTPKSKKKQFEAEPDVNVAEKSHRTERAAEPQDRKEQNVESGSEEAPAPPPKPLLTNVISEINPAAPPSSIVRRPGDDMTESEGEEEEDDSQAVPSVEMKESPVRVIQKSAVKDVENVEKSAEEDVTGEADEDDEEEDDEEEEEDDDEEDGNEEMEDEVDDDREDNVSGTERKAQARLLEVSEPEKRDTEEMKVTSQTKERELSESDGTDEEDEDHEDEDKNTNVSKDTRAGDKETTPESTQDVDVEKERKSLEEMNSTPDTQMIVDNKDDGEKPRMSESKDENEKREKVDKRSEKDNSEEPEKLSGLKSLEDTTMNIVQNREKDSVEARAEDSGPDKDEQESEKPMDVVKKENAKGEETGGAQKEGITPVDLNMNEDRMKTIGGVSDSESAAEPEKPANVYGRREKDVAVKEEKQEEKQREKEKKSDKDESSENDAEEKHLRNDGDVGKEKEKVGTDMDVDERGESRDALEKDIGKTSGEERKAEDVDKANVVSNKSSPNDPTDMDKDTHDSAQEDEEDEEEEEEEAEDEDEDEEEYEGGEEDDEYDEDEEEIMHMETKTRFSRRQESKLDREVNRGTRASSKIVTQEEEDNDDHGEGENDSDDMKEDEKLESDVDEESGREERVEGEKFVKAKETEEEKERKADPLESSDTKVGAPSVTANEGGNATKERAGDSDRGKDFARASMDTGNDAGEESEEAEDGEITDDAKE